MRNRTVAGRQNRRRSAEDEVLREIKAMERMLAQDVDLEEEMLTDDDIMVDAEEIADDGIDEELAEESCSLSASEKQRVAKTLLRIAATIIAEDDEDSEDDSDDEDDEGSDDSEDEDEEDSEDDD